RYPSKIVKRACYDTSTSNLGNHIKSCNPGVSAIKKYTAGGDYNKGCFRFQLALWVAIRNRPHLAVMDEELVAAFRALQPNVHVPSNKTVGHDVKLIFKLTKWRLNDCCWCEHPGAIHAMLNGWTSPNVLSLVGLVIQFITNHELKSFLLDMI
ncbi:hypothetical protein C8F01DRAFT_952537, partial [Mycena amicta]